MCQNDFLTLIIEPPKRRLAFIVPCQTNKIKIGSVLTGTKEANLQTNLHLDKVSSSHIKSWSSQCLGSRTCELIISKIGVDVQLLKDSQERAKTRSSWLKCEFTTRYEAV